MECLCYCFEIRGQINKLETSCFAVTELTPTVLVKFCNSDEGSCLRQVRSRASAIGAIGSHLPQMVRCSHHRRHFPPEVDFINSLSHKFETDFIIPVLQHETLHLQLGQIATVPTYFVTKIKMYYLFLPK